MERSGNYTRDYCFQKVSKLCHEVVYTLMPLDGSATAAVPFKKPFHHSENMHMFLLRKAM